MRWKDKPYPELRRLLLKYDLGFDGFAAILNKSTSSITKKLNNKVDFTRSECFETVKYFNDLGENVTVQRLFFDWVYPIGDKEESA